MRRRICLRCASFGAAWPGTGTRLVTRIVVDESMWMRCGRPKRLFLPRFELPGTSRAERFDMNKIIWLVGAIVIVIAILSWLGFR